MQNSILFINRHLICISWPNAMQLPGHRKFYVVWEHNLWYENFFVRFSISAAFCEAPNSWGPDTKPWGQSPKKLLCLSHVQRPKSAFWGPISLSHNFFFNHYCSIFSAALEFILGAVLPWISKPWKLHPIEGTYLSFLPWNLKLH